MSATPLLKTRNLRCEFKRGDSCTLAVAGANFEIAAGEILGLVGESGSGKSTLGRLLCGLQLADAGEIVFKGEALPRRFSAADFRRFGRHIRMVFQDSYSTLNPRLRVRESLLECLRLSALTQEEKLRTLSEWLDKVQLADSLLNSYPHELSGGQRQRLGIAAALMPQPDLVICDEPVSALDVSVQANILNLLRDLQRETGVAMLFISHDLGTVRYLCDRLLVMYRGHVVESGSVPSVFNNPAHPYTRMLLEARPVPDPSVIMRSPGIADMNLADAGACAYSPRCALAIAACGQRPLMAAVGEGHEAACYRSGESVASALSDSQAG